MAGGRRARQVSATRSLSLASWICTLSCRNARRYEGLSEAATVGVLLDCRSEVFDFLVRELERFCAGVQLLRRRNGFGVDVWNTGGYPLVLLGAVYLLAVMLVV